MKTNKIYEKSGFLNMPYIIDNKEYPFTFIIGGRGIGKTFGALHYLIESGKKFILLRTTEDEAKLCASEAGNPFKKINSYYKKDIQIENLNKHMWLVVDNETNKNIGLIMALTTFSKVRGLDFSDYDTILYDEFIPERIQKRIPATGESLFNCYETVNRNREIEGQAPVKLICMANALNINNEILIKWNLVSIIQKLKKTESEIYSNQDIGLLFIMPQNSPISEAKLETALYKISQRFNDMATGNKFREYYEKNIKSVNIKNYVIMAKFDDMCLYRSCCDRTYYITSFFSGRLNKKDIYTDTDYERKTFTRRFYFLTDAYYRGSIIFENAELELTFLNLFKQLQK